ncbi:hypothetical protein HNR46_000595 [Haloferula luteola]|uniref:ABC-2 family transporter protein n=1 Tax=Haloferula luteola TaxID=595692 RepID=A0A840VBW5_9BACT|nr:hypothetical protein [Haloferula luteola]MBB5350371.1 hypothetical protein [Haloferula luteola]
MSEEDMISLRPRRHGWWAIPVNPIFRRYACSRLRLRGGGVGVFLAVLGAGFLFALCRSIGFNRTDYDPMDAERTPLIPLMVLQCVILFALGTAQVAGGMTGERDEGVIDYQRLLPMSPLAKVLGFLFGLPVREWAMFAVTFPFSLWGLVKGGVDPVVWMRLYAVLISSALLYHFTGLVTGMVVKNRRWAFLTSIGLVFGLYTVVPQLAKLGLVTFKYLTIVPIFEESLPSLLPEVPASMVKLSQRWLPTVKFFNLDFSEAWFTVFSQLGLMLTFLRMLCRRWERTESHLLGKTWATGFFIWIQVLLLGTALPEIGTGGLFPSRGMGRLIPMMPDRAPEKFEAVWLSGIYGLFSLVLLYGFALMVTPSPDRQLAGWRRAVKQGRSRLPWSGDAATSFGWIGIMALAGATAWFVFTQRVVESDWFPGQVVPQSVAGWMVGLLLALAWGFQALLELHGRRAVFMAAILVGAVPLMVGAVLGSISDSWWPTAVWVMGASPMTLPVYAAGSLLQIAELPASVARAVPRACAFWGMLAGFAAVWGAVSLRASRQRMAQIMLESGEKE